MTSRLNAILCACKDQLGSGCLCQWLRCRRTEARELRSDTPQQGACVRRVVPTEHLQTYCRGEAEAAAIALRRCPERRRSQAAESSGSPRGQVCTKMASTYRSGFPSNRRASQTFTVPSALTETSCWPSGLNATGYRRRSLVAFEDREMVMHALTRRMLLGPRRTRRNEAELRKRERHSICTPGSE